MSDVKDSVCKHCGQSWKTCNTVKSVTVKSVTGKYCCDHCFHVWTDD